LTQKSIMQKKSLESLTRLFNSNDALRVFGTFTGSVALAVLSYYGSYDYTATAQTIPPAPTETPTPTPEDPALTIDLFRFVLNHQDEPAPPGGLITAIGKYNGFTDTIFFENNMEQGPNEDGDIIDSRAFPIRLEGSREITITISHPDSGLTLQSSADFNSPGFESVGVTNQSDNSTEIGIVVRSFNEPEQSIATSSSPDATTIESVVNNANLSVPVLELAARGPGIEASLVMTGLYGSLQINASADLTTSVATSSMSPQVLGSFNGYAPKGMEGNFVTNGKVYAFETDKSVRYTEQEIGFANGKLVVDLDQDGRPEYIASTDAPSEPNPDTTYQALLPIALR
jgi:hypothetical protein